MSTHSAAGGPRLRFALLLGCLSQAVGAQVNCNPGVSFYPEGPLKQCLLNGDHRIHTERFGAVDCADGARLALHRDGTLERCTLRSAAQLGAVRCEAGTEVVFTAAGELAGCEHAPPEARQSTAR
jgi:hypothetical protein